MTEVKIMISDEFEKFNEGDVLVYDKKNKCFTAVSIRSLTKEYIDGIKTEKVELENQLKKEIERYKFMADRFHQMTDELLLRLGGGKRDV